MIHILKGLVNLKSYVKSNLGEYLESRGINKSWVAREIGATKAQVNNWCKNDDEGKAISTPSVVYVLRLQKLLEIRIEDVYEEIVE